MPVEKFRSAEAMQAAAPTTSIGAPFDRFLRHCARYRRLAPRDYPRGIFRFRSIEEAQAARQRVAALTDSARGRVTR
jgi:hypothetical protein